MAAPLVHLDRVNIAFGDRLVLKDFSLSIGSGEIVSVVGESGSGKSIGALMSMGLLSPAATITAHSAELFGEPLQEISPTEWQSLRGVRIAMVFQDPMTALHPSMRIGAQLEEVLERHTDLRKSQRHEKIISALAEVEIPDPEQSAQKYPHEMSGGQRQRVVIAMAMLLDPDLIIADEPTTALDKEVEAKVLELLERGVRKRGSALWFISHDLEVVASFSDRVLVLFRGETVEEGPARQIFDHPEHAYTKGLLACRPPKEGRPYPLPTLEDFLERGKTSEQETLIAPESCNAIIAVEGLRIGYTRKKGWKTTKTWVVDGLDFELYEGETLGLIGPSGSGKSSIGRALVGLNAFEARRFIKGDARRIQFIFQDPFSALNGAKSIGTILTDVLRKHQPDLSATQRTQRAAALLEEVGLAATDLAKKPKAFSGGQRQRIGIARALAAQPDILICDESVSALDVSVQAQVLNLLNGIKKNRGLSMIFISHDPDVVRYMCDRIINL
ncbi:MAG: hypothetical protein RL754_663 [Bacteroidota bacterium]